ncbi:MAG TPA: AAA family ATPase [Allosphingosinicella sp.]|jgi:predicted ATPase|nr:AAA family ATPase [Allosphingosinicella sp.]
MRLLRVYIDGYRNLKNVEINFDKESLTTVIIGENGSGKSNLIEAIVEVFRAWDLREQRSLKFGYAIDYEIGGELVRIWGDEAAYHARVGSSASYDVVIPGNPNKGGISLRGYFPDLIFGYYSGSGRKLEKLFDTHQARYYGVINKERKDAEYEAAQAERKLFYCRPIHGVFALLSYFALPGRDKDTEALLTEKLGITGFHSALAHFKEPSWFNHGTWQKSRSTATEVGRGRRTYDTLGEQALDIWGARGPAGSCARALRETAFHPLTMAGKVVDDYRHKPRTEAQLACFLRDKAALKSFAGKFDTDQEMFAALEAADISDLIREMIVWVTRTNDDSGDISFSDLSDGERQLLMVLGLIRVSRGKEALFLLDEPDTHLNPAWQLTYLDLIREWTEIAADEDSCQIIMTTHNPLTIAALEAKEVRVMSADADGCVSVSPPRIDPRGLGFAGVLTDIFGLSSSLDKPTQELIDRRNELAREERLTPALAREFAEIREELRHLGFLYEERDKLYSEFLKQLDSVELADVDPLTPAELRAREAESRRIIEELLDKK